MRLLFSFHGADTLSQVGQRISSIGDVNGDGLCDIAVSSNVPRGTYVFYGNPVGDTVPAALLRGASIPAISIDVDGDGINDLVTCEIATAWPNYPSGTIYFYRGYGDSVGPVPFDSLSPGPDNHGFGATIASALVNEDQFADLLTNKSYFVGGDTLFLYYGPLGFGASVGWEFGLTGYGHRFSGRAFTDVNGDSQLDIVVGLSADQDSSGYVYMFYGPVFGLIPDVVLAPPVGYESDGGDFGKKAFAQNVTPVGDCNYDGFVDLAIHYGTTVFLYYCGPSMDTLFDLRLGQGLDVCEIGDFNGDSYGDIATGWSHAGWGGVDVFLGGPRFDGTYDYCIMSEALPPNFLDFIGYTISSAGDFDGDGIDDLLFSARNFFGGWPGDVLIVAGSSDVVTDVPIDNDRNKLLPSSIGQNYPNPFNASTTIPIKLGRKEYVRVAIYNTLGEEVVELYNGLLASGQHMLSWDGRSEAGEPVSSGVYLVKLFASESTRVIKTVIIK